VDRLSENWQAVICSVWRARVIILVGLTDVRLAWADLKKSLNKKWLFGDRDLDCELRKCYDAILMIVCCWGGAAAVSV